MRPFCTHAPWFLLHPRSPCPVLPCTMLHPCSHVFTHAPLCPCAVLALHPSCFTCATSCLLPRCLSLYICLHTALYIHYTLHFPAPSPVPSSCPCHTDYRLEEQLAKATLVADNTRGSRTHGSKHGHSPSLSPEPQGQSGRHCVGHPARHGHYSPSTLNCDRLSPPPKDTKRCRVAKSTSDPQQSFQSGAAGNRALSACTICLGRHPHNIFNCASATLWDGSPARGQKNSQGRLVNPAGSILCSDWQRPNGCSSSTHNSCHECSGCGKPSHGAQSCPQAQKA